MILEKLSQLLTSPDIAIPIWGAVGGALRVALSARTGLVKGVFLIVLGAVFAHLFTAPLITYLALSDNSASGVGAVLGITSYELARGLTSLNFKAIFNSFTKIK